jgi:hypothetical protein
MNETRKSEATVRSYRWARRYGALICGTALAFPFGRCNFGEFTSTSTVTLDSRQVIAFLVRGAILTPIEQAIDAGVNRLFDAFQQEDE